jgi:hypothetical protein
MPILRSTPFEDWKKKQVEEQIAKAIIPEYDTNKKFLAGDHWQDGKGWIGPHPMQGEEGSAEALREIQAGFTSRNVFSEIVERHSAGVAGREPIWAVVPKRDVTDDEPLTEQEESTISEVEAALTGWWNKRNIASKIREWSAILLWASRSVFRLYIPKGLLPEGADGSRMFEATDLVDALDHIFPDIPLPETAILYQDPNTMEKIGILSRKVDEKVVIELTYRVAEDGEGYEADKGTVAIRVIEGETDDRFTLPLANHLTMYQGERQLLLTQQAAQNQRALNLALSILPRNIVTGGFLERILLNAQMPGEWETDAEGNRIKFKPDLSGFRAGPGTTTFLAGVDTVDESGKANIATPGVVFREPIETAPAISAKDSHYRDMLEEVDQAHVLMNADANASGRSREQARSDYINSLLTSALETEACGRWLLETALALAEFGSNQVGKWSTDFRVDFNCQLDPGPISIEERQQNVAEAKEGFLSHETAMARNGVTDVAAERAIIDGQDQAALALLKQRAEIMQILTTAGASLREAGEIAGLDEDQLKLLEVEDDTEPPTGAPPAIPPFGGGAL